MHFIEKVTFDKKERVIEADIWCCDGKDSLSQTHHYNMMFGNENDNTLKKNNKFLEIIMKSAIAMSKGFILCSCLYRHVFTYTNIGQKCDGRVL